MTVKMTMTNQSSKIREVAAGERGVTLIELVIVVAMITVVCVFGLLQVASARRAIELTNQARQFAAYVDKARLDSIRRHADATAQMANVTITAANSYAVTIDADGNGTLDAARSFTFPPGSGISFTGATYPTVIRFNWRGRTVDSSGNLTNVAAFGMQDTDGHASGPINVTSSGDTSINANVQPATVTNSVTSAPVLRPQTY